ncbi:MAG: DUF3298 and DUF4163 domain-containing protein [Bacillota bacterium]
MGEPTKRKSAAWTTVVAVVLVALFQVGKFYGPELLSRLPVKVHNVEVTAETETGESPEFRYSLRLPVFTTSDPDVQRILDTLAEKISDDARTEVQTMRERAETDALWAKEEGFDLPRYDYSIDFEVTCNRDNLLSVNTIQYFYTGGAHGEPLMLSYNIDLRSGKTLAIADLFTDVRTAKIILALGVSERIKAEPDRFFPDAADNAGVRDDQQFYFQDGYVVLHYGIYELAPYAAGLPKFAFGITELENVLQPRIRKALFRAAVE